MAKNAEIVPYDADLVLAGQGGFTESEIDQFKGYPELGSYVDALLTAADTGEGLVEGVAGIVSWFLPAKEAKVLDSITSVGFPDWFFNLALNFAPGASAAFARIDAEKRKVLEERLRVMTADPVTGPTFFERVKKATYDILGAAALPPKPAAPALPPPPAAPAPVAQTIWDGLFVVVGGKPYWSPAGEEAARRIVRLLSPFGSFRQMAALLRALMQCTPVEFEAFMLGVEELYGQ